MKNGLLRMRKGMPYSPQRVGKQAPSAVKALFLLAASLLLSGCATQPVSSTSAVLVPATRLHNAALTVPDAGKLKITVTRDSGFVASGCAVNVLIDRQLVASLKPAERVVFYVEHGQHILGAQMPGGICGKEVVQTSLQAPVYRIGFSAEGTTIKLEPSAY